MTPFLRQLVIMSTSDWEPLATEGLWKKYKLEHDMLSSYTCFKNYFQAQVSKTAATNPEFYAMRAFNETSAHVNATKKYLFYLLCVAGGVYALCSGFDGMVAVLSVCFQELYIGLVIALGVLSALSALGIFIARDKPSILESLGLKSHQHQALIDEYIFSLQVYIHHKKQAILHKTHAINDLEIEELKGSCLMLKDIFSEKKVINEETKNSWLVYLQVNFAMFVGGVLFCSDGFFVGENVANFFFSQSFNLGLTISLIVALFALASYCYVECSSLKEYLYDRLFTDHLMTCESLEELDDDLAFFEHVSPGS
jgi:hypothetical protein